GGRCAGFAARREPLGLRRRDLQRGLGAARVGPVGAGRAQDRAPNRAVPRSRRGARAPGGGARPELMAPAAEPLLDPSFLIELEALRRMLRPRVASGGSGDRVGAARGGSAEFREHRAYAPGDDPRRIDWLAFARTGTP